MRFIRCMLVVMAEGAALGAEVATQRPEAVLVVSADASGRTGPGPVPRTVRVPMPWIGDVAEAKSTDGALEASVRREGAGLIVDAAWRKRAWVHLAAVELTFQAERVTAIGRDLEPAASGPHGRAMIFERFDPKWIQLWRGGAPTETLVVDDNVDGVVVRARGGKVTVRIELDAIEARPFTHDAHCATDWHAPNQHLPVSVRLRLPDERVLSRLQILPGAPTPIAKAKYPDGRRAAWVVTDHADQSTTRTLEALSETLIRLHLPITKALFSRGEDRPQLEDPKMVRIADALAQAGSEIVPHSATPRRDERSVTAAALDRFERWKTRTWIDHQPETNCEAFGDQGFRTGGRFGIADLLAAHHYQYVWAQADTPPYELNLLKPRRLGARAPTVWPIGRLDLGGPDSLWMFRSVWAFLEAKRFLGMYTPAKLDRLERERGLHIAHTYLETYHPKRTAFGLRNLLVPVDAKKDHPGGPGAVRLDPRFVALLEAIAARVERKSLWVPTLGELADRLRAVADVTLTIKEGGRILAQAPKAISGATFVVHQPNAEVTIAGSAPRGVRSDGRVTTFWDDLPAGETEIVIAPGETATSHLADGPHPR